VDYTTITKDTARATINTVHGHTALLISTEEANRSDEATKRRLVSTRKLSLVVDLDQTIIHATVDPTVGEWMNDPLNPNYDAVSDVRTFQLLDDIASGRRCVYYIKFRPGLEEFLEKMSELYEMHIYTMGTRSYAQNIARLVDPDRRIFGDRILSRDESGSMTVKNLKRLFPVDTKMVVIIDDRGDVWHWTPNLVKVNPFDFFVGIGDINSSFLPKRPGIDVDANATSSPVDATVPELPDLTSLPHTDDVKSAQNDNIITNIIAIDAQTSAIDQLIEPDPDTIEEKSSERDHIIDAQVSDRPLQKQQAALDAEDEATSPSDQSIPSLTTSPQVSSNETVELNSTNTQPTPPRHNLLHNSDQELQFLGQHLSLIHTIYFVEYNRLLSLQPPQTTMLPSNESPDVATLLPPLKMLTLQGCRITFTGLFPPMLLPRMHDFAIWAQSFGAVIQDDVDRTTTHVIAHPDRRTIKVRHAIKRLLRLERRDQRRVQRGRLKRVRLRVKIVSKAWLFDSLGQWDRMDESDYTIHQDLLAEERLKYAKGEDTDAERRRKRKDGMKARWERDYVFPNVDNGDDDDGETNEEREALKLEIKKAEDEYRAKTLAEDQKGKKMRYDDRVKGIVTDTESSTDEEDHEQARDHNDKEVVAELEKYAPHVSKEDSHVKGSDETKQDWDDINGQLAEFLGTDDDEEEDEDDADNDDDADEERFDNSITSGSHIPNGNTSDSGGENGRKRKRDLDDDQDTDEGRESRLRHNHHNDNDSSGKHKTSIIDHHVNTDQKKVDGPEIDNERQDEENEEEDLEAQLEAEMARQLAEEEESSYPSKTK